MHSKLQRWTDLIAALLARRLGATFRDLTGDVPGYADGASDEHKESVKRTFERDKDELRNFGVPIETLEADESDNTRYRLRSRDFYLPFLSLADEDATPTAPAEGYRSLGIITLTPDDLSLIGAAIARLQRLGDPALTADARSAANKLAFDLPIFDSIASDLAIVDSNAGADPKIFDVIADAVRNRKLVSFHYHKPGDDQPRARSAEPLGLFFINAHWYLAGWVLGPASTNDDATPVSSRLKNFRLSRMSKAKVNKKAPGTPDFDVPAGFNLRTHAKSRDAWELGDTQPTIAEVRFIGRSGAAAAAARAGEEVAGQPDLRRYSVRRLDTFARWLLSFAGDAQPVSPPALIAAYRELATATLRLYEQRPKARKSKARTRKPRTQN